jgi:tryptophan synthase alpha chain
MGKLGIYLLANYPSRETFIEAVKICDSKKIDFLEIGFPFSDPIADGDTLEKACYETLQRYDFHDTISSFREVKKIFKGKIYIMTYTNIVYSPGIDNFAERVGAVSGIILADLPLREAGPFEKVFRKYSINFVSKRGTTGGEFALDEETQEKIARVKAKGGEVFLGFGIKDRKDIELAFQHADGAIIGTKAISELEGGIDNFSRYIEGLRSQIVNGKS